MAAAPSLLLLLPPPPPPLLVLLVLVVLFFLPTRPRSLRGTGCFFLVKKVFPKARDKLGRIRSSTRKRSKAGEEEEGREGGEA